MRPRFSIQTDHRPKFTPVAVCWREEIPAWILRARHEPICPVELDPSGEIGGDPLAIGF